MSSPKRPVNDISLDDPVGGDPPAYSGIKKDLPEENIPVKNVPQDPNDVSDEIKSEGLSAKDKNEVPSENAAIESQPKENDNHSNKDESEGEKLEEKSKAISKTSQLTKDALVNTLRSNILTMDDRHQLEQKVMK